jgi:ubiquinone/menaquinone biosynthesis C-methylase UbiE
MFNDYDKYAKARQDALLNGASKPHRFVEKPMMRSMLGDLSGKKVLMLGCGTGEETALLEEFGAGDLVGMDLSENSIKIAAETYPRYQFVVGDMHELPFGDGEFDFVYSSLTIHYSDNPEKVYAEIYRVLRPDGQLLFSVGHPIRWASQDVQIGALPLRVTGHTREHDGEQVVYGSYNTFARHEHFFSDSNPLSFYTGAPSMHFKLLRRCGFVVEDFTESRCVEEAREVDEDYYLRYSELPQFMAFLAKK